jgi:hypothetical protein
VTRQKYCSMQVASHTVDRSSETLQHYCSLIAASNRLLTPITETAALHPQVQHAVAWCAQEQDSWLPFPQLLHLHTLCGWCDLSESAGSKVSCMRRYLTPKTVQQLLDEFEG